MKTVPLLAVLLAGCVPTAENVRIDDPRLEALRSETEIEEKPDHTTRITRWRSPTGAYPHAGLLVQTLGGQYASSGVFFSDTPDNSLAATLRHAESTGIVPTTVVIDEGEAVNFYGKAPYVRVSGSGTQCVFSQQYVGGSPRYENYRHLLGHTRIVAWFCDASVDPAAAAAFVAGVR